MPSVLVPRIFFFSWVLGFCFFKIARLLALLYVDIFGQIFIRPTLSNLNQIESYRFSEAGQKMLSCFPKGRQSLCYKSNILEIR